VQVWFVVPEKPGPLWAKVATVATSRHELDADGEPVEPVEVDGLDGPVGDDGVELPQATVNRGMRAVTMKRNREEQRNMQAPCIKARIFER
jgi:hypothetical protein